MTRPWSGITGSSAYDVLACPARAALPVRAFTSSEYADRGNEIHAYARKVAIWPNRREDFLAEVPPKWRHTCAGLDLVAALQGISPKHYEIAYALDVKARTCRKIGENIGRRYNEYLRETNQPELGEWEIPFTLDVEGSVGDTPVEEDFKSGQYLGDPSQHGQRKISASGLMLHHGASEAISRIAYIDDDGNVTIDGCEFTILDAWQVCDDMVRMIDAVWEARSKVENGSVPDFYPDREKQCRYCPSQISCPYWVNLAKACLGELQGFGDLEGATPEQMGKALDYVKTCAKLIETLNDNLRGIALNQALPVDEQYEYRAEPKRGRSWFDADGARGMITTLAARLEEDDAAIVQRIKSLTKPGAMCQEVRKRKRLEVGK